MEQALEEKRTRRTPRTLWIILVGLFFVNLAVGYVMPGSNVVHGDGVTGPAA